MTRLFRRAQSTAVDTIVQLPPTPSALCSWTASASAHAHVAMTFLGRFDCTHSSHPDQSRLLSTACRVVRRPLPTDHSRPFPTDRSFRSMLFLPSIAGEDQGCEGRRSCIGPSPVDGRWVHGGSAIENQPIESLRRVDTTYTPHKTGGIDVGPWFSFSVSNVVACLKRPSWIRLPP